MDLPDAVEEFDVRELSSGRPGEALMSITFHDESQLLMVAMANAGSDLLKSTLVSEIGEPISFSPPSDFSSAGCAKCTVQAGTANGHPFVFISLQSAVAPASYGLIFEAKGQLNQTNVINRLKLSRPFFQ